MSTREMDTQLEQALAGLRSVQARDAQKAAQGRAAFLAQAEEIRPSVTAAQKPRHNNWFAALAAQLQPRKKEYAHMFNVITTLILVLGILFGGSGITLAAAQDALPEEPLYVLKMWTEQVQYNLAGEDVESQMQLSLQFANRRMEELATMLTKGDVSDQAVLARLAYRYQAQLENSMRLAASLPTETEITAALDEIINEVGVHIQKLDQDRIQGRTGAPEDALLSSIRSMLQHHMTLIGEVEDPLQLRYQWQHQTGITPEETVEGVTDETTTEKLNDTDKPAYGPGPFSSCLGDDECVPFGPKFDLEKYYGPGPYPYFAPTARGPQEPQFNGSGTQPGPGPQTPSPNGSK